jgi:hypothetical protein
LAARLHVGRAAVRRRQPLAQQQGGEDRHGRVDEEDAAPAEACDERAAQQWTGRERAAADRCPGRDRGGAARGGVVEGGDQRQGGGQQQGTGHAEQRTGDDERAG